MKPTTTLIAIEEKVREMVVKAKDAIQCLKNGEVVPDLLDNEIDWATEDENLGGE